MSGPHHVSGRELQGSGFEGLRFRDIRNPYTLHLQGSGFQSLRYGFRKHYTYRVQGFKGLGFRDIRIPETVHPGP